MNRFLICIAAAAAPGLAGCVAGSALEHTDALTQQLEVHAILDHREVSGVGCLLTNDSGRWFVVAPGRVTVKRSSRPLVVDCKRDKIGSAEERWSPTYGANRLVGRILSFAGVRDYVNGNYAYQPVITVVLQAARADDAQAVRPDPAAPLY